MRIFCLLLVPVVLALVGCLPPATTHPVGTTVGLHPDPTLVGLWRGKMSSSSDDERDSYFHFLPKLDGSITVVLVQAGNKPDGDWMTASVTSATVGSSHFLNAKITHGGDNDDKDDVTQNTFPMLYRFDGPRKFTLYFLNEDAVKDAIKSGAIKGTIDPGTMGDATITADPKALDAFLSSKRGLALFSEPFATLTKME